VPGPPAKREFQPSKGIAVAVKYRDYYEVLGVPRTAPADDIKRAYRKLARKHHPDIHAPAERQQAAERFKEINEAYEVLRDPDKRARYDALGDRWKSGSEFTPPPGTEWHGGEVDWEDLGGFSDFFAAMFGQNAGRATRGRQRGGRVVFPGSDVEAELPVTLDELLRGGRRRIAVEGGRTLDVEIPRGARDGTVLRMAGQGQPGSNGAPPGDLYLRLRMTPHPTVRVQGDDLQVDLPLWPWQAVLGASVRIETPEGAVKLQVPEGTQSGGRLRLRGRGLPRRDDTRGDLYAVVRIVVPERPGAAEREAYEALRRAATAPPDRPAEG
jgi:curved DNA-binding protein